MERHFLNFFLAQLACEFARICWNYTFQKQLFFSKLKKIKNIGRELKILVLLKMGYILKIQKI